MCLQLPRFTRKLTAKKDIVCYKWLAIDMYDYLKTPYQHQTVIIGETYKSELILPKNFFHRRNVNIGIHSFKNRQDAIRDVHFHSNCIVKCVIPKGSKYCIGKFGVDISYASDTLQYVAIIDHNTWQY